MVMEKIKSNKDDFLRTLGNWDLNMPIVIEACASSRPVINYLKELEFSNIIVVHPAATIQMRNRGKKTDAVDAAGLAELARLGLAGSWRVHVPGELAQNIRDLLYEREFVVKQRVSVTNRVKALFRREGRQAPPLKGKRDWERLEELLPEYADQARFMAGMRRMLLDRERQLTSQIRKESRKHPQYAHVKSVPCVGDLTAAVLLAFVDDFTRFKGAHAMASYFGLVPSVYQTGDTERTGSITKRGNKLARKILVQAAHHARYSSCPFNPIYRDLIGKKGKQRATVAVAKKIVHAAFGATKNNEQFDPEKMGLIKVDEEIVITRAYELSKRKEGCKASSPVPW
jgi:transposase